MKKGIIVFLVFSALTFMLSACKENSNISGTAHQDKPEQGEIGQDDMQQAVGDQEEILQQDENEPNAATQIVNEPKLSEIKSICELATMECFYHNVAKSVKEKGTGLVHIGEVDRTFWIEYTGEAKLGIDLSKVSMTLKGNEVTIKMPEAELLSCKVEEMDENDYILSQDSWINENPITAEEQTQAIDEAQEQMRESIMANQSLLSAAKERAKTLIENYINQLGQAAGIEYEIIWEDVK